MQIQLLHLPHRTHAGTYSQERKNNKAKCERRAYSHVFQLLEEGELGRSEEQDGLSLAAQPRSSSHLEKEERKAQEDRKGEQRMTKQIGTVKQEEEVATYTVDIGGGEVRRVVLDDAVHCWQIQSSCSCVNETHENKSASIEWNGMEWNEWICNAIKRPREERKGKGAHQRRYRT